MIQVVLSDAIPHELISILESQNLVEAVVSSLATSARAKWVRLAVTDLKTSRQTYRQGIGEVGSDKPGERYIILSGWLANAIESGLAPYDLRDTILLNPNSTIRRPIWSQQGRSGGSVQVGWYANIPFRHGTPGTTGLAGTPMGEQHGPRGDKSRALTGGMSGEEAKAFGKEIYRAAKKLRTRSVSSKGHVTPGQSLREAQAGPKLAEHHTTSIYTGMKRVRKPYKNERTGKTTVQTQYTTFRRISTSNPTGWIHPGIEPHNFSEKVADHVNDIAGATIGQVLDGALGGA